MPDRAVQATPVSDLTRRDVEAFSSRFDEPRWMREFRLSAFAAYEAMPWPASTDEAWRRTDFKAFDLARVAPLSDASPGPPVKTFEGALDPAQPRDGLLMQRNVQTLRAEMNEAVAARGVVFTDMRAALRQHADLVREVFMRECVRPAEGKFRALHAALWSGGTFVYVPRGVEVMLPLLSHTWVDAPAAGLFPHTVIVAEPGSTVTVIDAFASPAGDGYGIADGVTELIVRDGAQVRYVALQEWGRDVLEVGIIRSHLARDSTLHNLLVGLGGKVVKVDVESILQGPGASSEMLGLVFAGGRQHFDLHTLQEHRAPHTLSDLLYKNAVTERARSIFSGMIRVHQGAQKTNAFQANRNLILSEGAKADSIPNLEIMANDLRCTHGSATSRLNEEHLFYLMSRGLPRAEAVRMVVEGFFAELLDRIPLERVRQRVQSEINRRMVQ